MRRMTYNTENIRNSACDADNQQSGLRMHDDQIPTRHVHLAIMKPAEWLAGTYPELTAILSILRLGSDTQVLTTNKDPGLFGPRLLEAH